MLKYEVIYEWNENNKRQINTMLLAAATKEEATNKANAILRNKFPGQEPDFDITGQVEDRSDIMNAIKKWALAIMDIFILVVMCVAVSGCSLDTVDPTCTLNIENRSSYNLYVKASDFNGHYELVQTIKPYQTAQVDMYYLRFKKYYFSFYTRINNNYGMFLECSDMDKAYGGKNGMLPERGRFIFSYDSKSKSNSHLKVTVE